MIISFSGHSSSGKTSVICRLKNQALFQKKDVCVGEEDRFLTVRIAKFLLGNKIFSGYKDERLRQRPMNGISGKIFSFLVQFIYPAILYFDFLLEYIYYEKIFQNRVLLRDRYIYDYLVAFEDILGIHNNVIRYLFIHFPKPYLSFYIKIDAATALKRNKNTRRGRLERKKSFHDRIIGSYEKLASTKKMIFMDGSTNINKSVSKIVELLELKNRLSRTKRIAIIGLDGAGKTTLARLFCEFVRQFNISCKIVHFYHENLLYKVLSRVGFYKVVEDDSFRYARNRVHAQKRKSAPFIIALLRFADSYIQFLFSLVRWRGSIIIFDRFFYDYLVSYEYLNVRWRSLFTRLVPHVDYVILLLSRPKVYYRRKPENTRDFFVQNHVLYRKLAKIYRFKVIDTTHKKPDYIVDEVVHALP